MQRPLCVVYCCPDTYSGYGAHSRDFLKALYEAKSEVWDIKVLSVRWGETSFGFIDNNEKDWGWIKPLIVIGNQLPKQPEYWFQITIPSEFQPIGKWNCGVTAGIETTLCHTSWIEGCNRMNLVLATSKFTKEVLEQSKYQIRDNNNNPTGEIFIKTPIKVLFEGVDTSKYFFIKNEDLPSDPIIEDLDEIEEDFCFLFVGHWLSGIIGEDRKNVGILVKTFLESFRNMKKPPALILKTSGGGTSIMDREECLSKLNTIHNLVEGKLPPVYLLHGQFTDSQMNLLYNHPKVKAMVSLTKGEGYGRPLAEFTQSKKPVVASNWSGHLDFLTKEHTYLIGGTITQVHPSAVVKDMILPEAGWFSANIDDVHRMWKAMYENYKTYLEPSKIQAFKIKTTLNLEEMKKELVKIMDESAPKYQPLIIPKLPSNLQSLPKLTKIEQPNAVQ